MVWKMTAEDWDFVQAVNLRGAFLLIRNTSPEMRKRSGGRIVLIGSINGRHCHIACLLAKQQNEAFRKASRIREFEEVI